MFMQEYIWLWEASFGQYLKKKKKVTKLNSLHLVVDLS